MDKIDTPCFTVCTKRGLPPYVTDDVVEDIFEGEDHVYSLQFVDMNYTKEQLPEGATARSHFRHGDNVLSMLAFRYPHGGTFTQSVTPPQPKPMKTEAAAPAAAAASSSSSSSSSSAAAPAPAAAAAPGSPKQAERTEV